jgi:hypothetical protein
MSISQHVVLHVLDGTSVVSLENHYQRKFCTPQARKLRNAQIYHGICHARGSTNGCELNVQRYIELLSLQLFLAEMESADSYALM